MTRPGPHLNPHPNTYPRQVCKLWRALHRTRLARASSAALRAAHAPHAPDAPQEADAEGGAEEEKARPEAPSLSLRPDPGAVRARLRELPPAQVKRMLLSHVRQCHNRRCETCRKLRERIRSRVPPA